MYLDTLTVGLAIESFVIRLWISRLKNTSRFLVDFVLETTFYSNFNWNTTFYSTSYQDSTFYSISYFNTPPHVLSVRAVRPRARTFAWPRRADSRFALASRASVLASFFSLNLFSRAFIALRRARWLAWSSARDALISLR